MPTLEKPEYRPLHTDRSGDVVEPASEASVQEAEWRELQYSWAGGFDAVSRGWGAFDALAGTRPTSALSSRPRHGDLEGRSSLLTMGEEQFVSRAASLAALSADVRGTRLAVATRGVRAEAAARRHGFTLVRRVATGAARYATDSAMACLSRGYSVWSIGTALPLL